MIIAAKCIEQALEFATECLNFIGLPLTPRLAEYLRPRLKGTEADVALEIDCKWEHIIFNWKGSAPLSIAEQRLMGMPDGIRLVAFNEA